MSALVDQLIKDAQIHIDLKEYREREETGDAELFSYWLHDRIAYDHAAKAWYLFQGSHWVRDQIGQVRQLVARMLAPEYLRAGAIALEDGNKEEAIAFTNRARALWKKNRIENVLSLAQDIPGVALKGTEWDLDPMLLCVQNGVIELKTGSFRDGQPSDYLRSCGPVDWLSLDCPAPHWEQFLREVFGGDQVLIAFIQRLLGYCITGLTTEHILPIFYGEGGRNGKTTMLETLASVLGRDLTHTTQADLLMNMRRDGTSAQPFVHALRGQRLVWATESQEGQRLNAGVVKKLTGGDSITTRTLYEKPTTFRPSHKTILLTNHKPHISADDLALWERILLILFGSRFVDNPKEPNEYKRRPFISEQLQNESAGILAWLVRGCLAWQQEGLNPPPQVRAATDEYHREEDTLSQFYVECLLEDSSCDTQAKEIYVKYAEWARSNGIEAMSSIALGKRLARRYGHPQRNMHGMIYKGVKVA